MNDTDSDARKPDYYARRAEQEQALAARSADPSARRVHIELAERYAALQSGGKSGA